MLPSNDIVEASSTCRLRSRRRTLSTASRRTAGTPRPTRSEFPAAKDLVSWIIGSMSGTAIPASHGRFRRRTPLRRRRRPARSQGCMHMLTSADSPSDKPKTAGHSGHPRRTGDLVRAARQMGQGLSLRPGSRVAGRLRRRDCRGRPRLRRANSPRMARMGEGSARGGAFRPDELLQASLLLGPFKAR